VAPGYPATVSDWEVPAIPSDRTAAIVFTSGSTGEPQPNEKTFDMLAVTARLIAGRFQLDRDPPAAIVATVPSQHMYGLETSVALPLWSEVSVHAARPFYPADVASALSSVPAPRVLVTTPIHLRALLSSRLDLPELRMAVSATARLSTEMAESAEQRLGAPVFEIYGFSEAGTVATRRTVEGARWRTCEGFTLRRSGDACLVEAAHLPAPLPLNDVVELHSAREFELLGRLSDNVNIAGKRTSLSGLNAVLNNIEGVTDGAFFLADEDDDARVTRLIAFAVAPGRSPEDLRQALRREIDPAFMPRQLYLVPGLPRSETGKLTKAALTDLARRMREGRA
jgi:acyl-coenzyme A synthetase/AMP-(fatty) acid ligase